MGPRAPSIPVEPPTCDLGDGGGSTVGPPPGSPQNVPASYHTRGSRSKMEKELAQSHLGREAFLALSTLDLCHCTTCLVPGGTRNKGCRPENSSDPAEQHCNSGFFLRACSCSPALPFVFRMLFRSHSRLKEGVLSPLPRDWWLKETNVYPKVGCD